MWTRKNQEYVTGMSIQFMIDYPDDEYVEDFCKFLWLKIEYGIIYEKYADALLAYEKWLDER